VVSMLLDRGGSSRPHLVFRLQIDHLPTSALSAFQNMVAFLSKVPQSKMLHKRYSLFSVDDAVIDSNFTRYSCEINRFEV
jgi:hypothetical protein